MDETSKARTGRRVADPDADPARAERAGAGVIDPIRCAEFIQTNATQLAQSKATRVYLEESLRSVKSIQMKKHAELPVSAQEREAYASDEYRTALAGLQAAVEAEEGLRWMMVAAQAKIEIWRSMEASGRAMDRATR